VDDARHADRKTYGGGGHRGEGNEFPSSRPTASRSTAVLVPDVKPRRDTLDFESGPSGFRMLVKYENYKQFRARWIFQYGDQVPIRSPRRPEGLRSGPTPEDCCWPWIFPHPAAASRRIRYPMPNKPVRGVCIRPARFESLRVIGRGSLNGWPSGRSWSPRGDDSCTAGASIGDTAAPRTTPQPPARRLPALHQGAAACVVQVSAANRLMRQDLVRWCGTSRWVRDALHHPGLELR